MKPATFTQTDLFANPDQVKANPTGLNPEKPMTTPVVSAAPRSPIFDLEAAIQALEATEDYRVLRRLKPREIDAAYRLGPGESIGIIVDCETTGLDHRHDEVIEIGMVAFVHDQTGRVGPVVGALSLLREPSVVITPEITRLTGITPEMVLGQVLDLEAVGRLLEPADLVIAHNAKFDRNFCERLHEDFCHKAWACSVAEVRWSELGYEGAKLGYLINQQGWFHRGHRAVDDCFATLEILAADIRDGSGSALGHLLTSSRQSRVRVWAERAPFDLKDALKRRGYRWNGGEDGRPKAWWTEVKEEDLAAELHFLETEVYLREVELRQEMISAYERYRAS